MKKNLKSIDEIILKYLDGGLDTKEQKTFENLLNENVLLQRRLDDIQRADHVIKQSGIESPSENFTLSVMSSLNQYTSLNRLSIKKGVMLLAGVLIITMLGVGLLYSGIFDHRTTIDLGTIHVEERYFKHNIPAILLDLHLTISIVVILNVALAFAVLDRAILKPWFRR